MPSVVSPRAAFAAALLSLDGVGRVTAHRVLAHFGSPAELRATPHEQVLLRIKGAPRAEALAATLQAPALADAVATAQAAADADAARGISTLAPGGDAWPAGLDALPPAARPVVLRAYGPPEALGAPLVAVLAAAPLDAEPFEGAERLVGAAAARGVAPVLGAETGVDLALLKRALAAGVRPVVVAGSGLGRVERSMRPALSQLTREGGLIVSPFGMTHGPFEHDLKERALVAAALARTVCAVAPAPGSPEDAAAAWAAEAHRPLVALAPGEAAWAERARTAEAPADAEALAAVV